MSLSDEMSRLTNQCLEAYDGRVAAVGSIRTATAQQLGEFRAAREAQTAATRQHLDQFSETLREDVGTQLHDQSAERQAMHADQRARLDQSMEQLKHEVESFLAQAAAERQQIHADHAGSRQAWAEFGKAMQQRRAGKR